MRGLLAVIGAAIVLAGCASPGERLQREALAAGLFETAVDGGAFSLTAYIRPGMPPARALHVYLDSDGTPWDRGYWPARDPSPRQPLALSLMRLDPAPSVYLNRPCYGQPELPPECHFKLWTGGRYSQAVVAALSHGLDDLRQRFGAERLVLIGHSGGGVLAMLLAARREDVAAVVTVGANLDHRQWTRHFGYEPLTESLNPADEAPLPAHVLRWHLIGERDAVVPPAVTSAGAANDPHHRTFRYPEFGHRCCWADMWPEILGELSDALESRPTPPHPASN